MPVGELSYFAAFPPLDVLSLRGSWLPEIYVDISDLVPVWCLLFLPLLFLAIYGAVAMLEGLITRVREEMETNAPVVATGGLTAYLKAHMSMIDHYDENLVLSGLHIIYHTHASGR